MNDIAPPDSAQEFVSPEAYPDYANPDLLDGIPLSAHTVLDVGCSAGALGVAYLRRNPRARYLGIDSDPVSVERARPRLSDVACVDVEETPLPFAIPEGIDCLIYGDVLEHLRNPWALLARHAAALNPDGTVLVCMPNVEHWSFTHRLLTGHFDYEPQGLLDRTHLRWFTPRMMGRALERAGLYPTDVRPRAIDQANAQRFVAAMEPALRNMGIEPEEYLNRAGPLQFVWRARKSIPSRIVVNATMLAPVGGVSDVRVIEPMRALSTDCSVVGSIMPEHDLNPPLGDAPRIAVLHRPLLIGQAGLARLRTLREKGYVIVTEFDDHPIFLENQGINTDSLLTFRAAHAIQTSTESLAAVLSAYNSEIAVFPNAVLDLPEPVNFTNPNKLTLLFAALNREDDWAPYISVLNEVARAVGERLQFRVVHDRRFYEALDTTHKDFTPTCDYPTYKSLLASSEICFMPLADTPFNRAKSDLKFIEAAACRVASLASPVVYEDSVTDGETGLIFRTPEALRVNLLRLLAYPDSARRLADAARSKIAAERMLAYQLTGRLAWYHSLWARRAELDAALCARVPELCGDA
jgi:2-polyprenyl-3-methyl-5-hydroxy-6-metoxy-1,4-benzoquinol methylase